MSGYCCDTTCTKTLHLWEAWSLTIAYGCPGLQAYCRKAIQNWQIYTVHLKRGRCVENAAYPILQQVQFHTTFVSNSPHKESLKGSKSGEQAGYSVDPWQSNLSKFFNRGKSAASGAHRRYESGEKRIIGYTTIQLIKHFYIIISL